jgi:methylase of polypeptide subunit release factors
MSLNQRQKALLGLGRTVRDTGYQFVTITPLSHQRINRRPENRWAASLRDVFGWSRPFRPGLVPAPMLDLMRAAEVLEEGEDGARSLVRLSSLGGDLFLHSAFPTESRDSVFFGPDTYKFVDAIRAHLATRRTPVARAADLCAGAGPGGIAIARAVTGVETALVDINESALSLSGVNAALAGLDNVRPHYSDLLSGVAGDFDLIVAHPPYLIDPGTRVYRHGGGPLGAELSLGIVRSAMGRLRPGGTLLLFTGVAILDGRDLFEEEVAGMLSDSRFRWSAREVDVDVFGEELMHPPYDQVDRIALVVLTMTLDNGA